MVVNANLGWFNPSGGPKSSRARSGPSQPPVFSSLGDMLKALEPAWAAREIEPEVIISWDLANQSMQVD
jgi:hypothetical protein